MKKSMDKNMQYDDLVVYEDNHVIVVKKKQNIPVQPDDSKDNSLLEMVKEYIKVKYQKPGNVYIGMVHRLDRPVGGLMVFARTSKGAARLSAEMRNGTFQKEYLAVIRGEMQEKQGVLRDFLIKDSRTNMVTVVNEAGDRARDTTRDRVRNEERDNARDEAKDEAKGKARAPKEALLEYTVLAEREGFSLVRIRLITGRPHQIRVQFSSRGFPLYGDMRYGKEQAQWRGNIALFAVKLAFLHPTTKETMTFFLHPPNAYPWTLFQRDDFAKCDSLGRLPSD